MIARLVGICCVAILTCVVPALAAERGPAGDLPELQVLSHYVGKWESKITSQDTPFVSADVTAEWVLDGRFVEQTASITVINSSQPLIFKTLMTYDPDQKKYRYWRFVSNGNVSESTGTWDAEKKTMTSVGKDGDVTATTTANFAKEGVEEWKIVVKDSSGNDVATIAGTNTWKAE